MTGPVRPRQARGAERVERLLTAAADLIAEHGVNGFAFRSVAQHADTAQGSLYQFFPSREALLTALHERYAGRAVELAREVIAASEALADEGGDPEERRTFLAREIVRRFTPFYRDNPAYSALRRWAAFEEREHVEDTADRDIAKLLAPVLRRFEERLSPSRALEVAHTLIEIADALLVLTVDDARRGEEAAFALSGYLDRALAK